MDRLGRDTRSAVSLFAFPGWLWEIRLQAALFDRSRPVAAICAGGYRSSIATSVLERLGFLRATNVVGGMAAWSGATYETVTD